MMKVTLANPSANDTLTSGNIRLGPLSTLDQVKVDEPIFLGAQCNVKRSAIGRYTGIGDRFKATDCTIGAFCAIGDNVTLNAGRHPVEWTTSSLFSCNPNDWNWVQEYRDATRRPESYLWRLNADVGNDVWIGSNVVVVTGATIGDGAVIGSNSVVTHSVHPYEIVAGAPAKVLRKRFDDETIAKLQATKWWTKPIAELLALQMSDPHAVIEALGR